MAPTKPIRRRARSIRSGAEDLTQEVERLLTLSAPALREQWLELFGAGPSPQIGRTLLIQAIAYRLQERALGGIKPSVQRILDQFVDEPPRNSLKRLPKRRINAAGTVLIREWRGVRHRVTVLDHEQVLYAGRHYKSLSEVAQAITGAHWSGPLFFGLRNRAREAAHG